MTTDSPDQRVGKWEHRSMSCSAPNCADDHLHRRPYKSCEPWVAGEYVQSEAGSTWTPTHAPSATADTEPAPPPPESELTPAQEQIVHSALYELNCRRLLALGDYLAEHYRGEYRAGEFMTEQAARLLTQQRAELAEVTAAHAQALVTIAELRRQLDGRAKP